MKPPYRFRTHEENLLARDYTEPVPNVLVIASNPTDGHRFFSQQHANVVAETTACIYNLRETVDLDSWRRTALFPYESMQTAPDTSFPEHENPGSAPSYQWYAKIEVACQNL